MTQANSQESEGEHKRQKKVQAVEKITNKKAPLIHCKAIESAIMDLTHTFPIQLATTVHIIISESMQMY